MFDNGVVTSEKRDNYEETQLRQRNGRKNNSILSYEIDIDIIKDILHSSRGHKVFLR